MVSTTYTVPPGNRRARADKVLAAAFPEHSRVAFHRAFAAGNVTREGVALVRDATVAAGDVITFAFPDAAPAELRPVDIPLEVIFEDKHLLAINKAAGMVVHPGVATGEDTLVHALLAHCAGIEGNYVNAGLETDLETWDKVIKVNLTGSFYGLKTVFPPMLKQRKGSVILVSSIVSSMATSSGVAYGASKAGLEHLARSFAIIGLRDGARVRCNSVHPGAIRTRMTENIFAELAEKAGVAKDVIAASVKDIIPYGERGEPEDIANMILFLASDESKYASGSDFKVDGAWHVTDVG